MRSTSPCFTNRKTGLARGFLAATAAAVIGLSTAAYSQTEYLNAPLRDGSLPAGWTATNVTFSTGAGGYANITGSTGILATPVFDASSGTSVVVDFSVAKFGTGTDGPVTIEYSINGGADWLVAGNSQTPTSSTYINDSITISASSATFAVRFTAANSPSAKRLRDVVISDPDGVVPLELATLSPTNSATEVPVSSTLALTFNQPVQAGLGSVILYLGASPVETFPASSGSYVDNTVTFTPAAPLSDSSSYHVIVEATALEDLSGNPFPGLLLNTDWAFTTADPDVTGPVATTLVPANNSTAIPLELAEIRVSFDEPVTLGTGTIELRRVDNDSVIFSVAANDPFGVFLGEPEELIIPLDESILEYSTQYYVSFPAGAVTDSLTNPSLAFGAPASASPWVFTTQAAPVPPTVVVNKYANVGGGTLDLIELLVIGSEVPGTTVDMRGMIVKDFTSSMGGDTGGRFEFADDVLWSAVPVGTLIVLNGGTTTTDTDASDFTLAVGLGNTSLFTSLGGSFDIATTEMIMIKSAGSGAAGVEGGIHALAAGSPGAQFNAFLGPKLIAASTTGTNNGVIANNSTSALDDYNGTDATGAVPVANMPFGSPNNSTNGVYINQLRGLNPGDGAGLVQLTNATPASPFAGTRVFGSGLAAQSVSLNLSLDIPAITVTDVTIDVPADFGVPVSGSITLAGPASTGAGVSVTGQTITITDAALTETDTLTVTIAGLDTPSTFASGDFGVRVFPVSTATSGGTLTGVSLDPAASVIVPIANLREVNASAIPLALGAVVAVEGVATVASLSSTNTQSAIQDATAGIALFDLETTSPFVRGNRYVVYGPVSQFNGLTQINYGGSANIFDLGVDTEPLAQEITIPALLAAAESLEGSVVTIKNLTYVSGTWAVAQNVTLQDADLNAIVIRIQSGSTAITEPAYPVTVTGIVGQFDSSNPFTSGYQLMPRDMADLAPGDEPPADDFAAWIAGFPGVGAFTGPFDTPMGDGVPNILKHILGLAADVAVTGALVEATASGPGSLTFVHTRIKPADLGSDVLAGYEWSTDLATWTADGVSSGGVTVVFGTPSVLDDTNPDFDVISVTASVTEGSASKVFVRLAGGVLLVD